MNYFGLVLAPGTSPLTRRTVCAPGVGPAGAAIKLSILPFPLGESSHGRHILAGKREEADIVTSKTRTESDVMVGFGGDLQYKTCNRNVGIRAI